MRITLAALAGVLFAATTAQAGSIQNVAVSKDYPSIQAFGGASITAPVAPVAKLKPSTAPQMTGDPRNPVDGRTQLELWAKANNTTVEKILMEKTNGFLQLKNKDGGGSSEPGTEEVATEEGAGQTDAGKTASVSPEGGEVQPGQADASGGVAEE